MRSRLPCWVDAACAAARALFSVFVNILGIPNSLNFAVMGTVILFGVLADQQLQARRRRKIALVGLARAAPRSTLAQGKQNASPHGAAAFPARTGDKV